MTAASRASAGRVQTFAASSVGRLAPRGTRDEFCRWQQARGVAVRGLDQLTTACYAKVMSIKRITISVPSTLAGRIKKAAGDLPVSAWVTDALEDRLNEVELERQWQAFYRDVNPTRRDLALADSMFKRLTKRGSRRGAA